MRPKSIAGWITKGVVMLGKSRITSFRIITVALLTAAMLPANAAAHASAHSATTTFVAHVEGSDHRDPPPSDPDCTEDHGVQITVTGHARRWHLELHDLD